MSSQMSSQMSLRLYSLFSLVSTREYSNSLYVFVDYNIIINIHYK